MKKLLLLPILLTTFNMFAGADEYEHLFRVMTDSATPSAIWLMAPVKKVLPVDFDPSGIKEAFIEYELLLDTVNPRTKVRAQADTKWRDMLITLNGKTVFCGSPGKLAMKGIHRVPVNKEYIKAGKNIITLAWAPLPKSAKGKKSTAQNTGHTGYIYVAADGTDAEKIRRKLPRDKRPAPDNDIIRIRLLVNI